MTGDAPSWSEASLDDSGWKAIRIGMSWERQGHAGYDGYAWYRLRFQIPKALQHHPDFSIHQSLKLSLGKIDDVDQTWFNGMLVGQTGKFPDAFQPAWLTTRTYFVSKDLIRWGAENVIAIRVYDGNGEGGMYEGKCQLEMPSWNDAISIAFDLAEGNGIFINAEPIQVAATLENATSQQLLGHLDWSLEGDEGTSITSVSSEVELSAMGTLKANRSFENLSPGFYKVTCSFRSEEKNITVSKSMIIGYEPEKIQAPLTKQNDFDKFWSNTLQSLAEVDPEFILTRKTKLDSDTHEVYEVKMLSLGGVRVAGWYEKPKAVGTFPSLLRVPGYGEDMQPTGSSEPLAIFSFNVRGHGNSQEDIKGVPSDFWIRGLDDEQGYYYQGAYADCIRAIDFIATRSEVDQQKIAVTGGSQGGGLSLASAALDGRVSLCSPDIPFMCSWKKYFKISHWPEIDQWIAAKPERSWEKTLQTMSYFDTLNLAERIKCPVLLGLGLQDDVCPPATIFAVYNRIPASKQYLAYPHAKHWVEASHYADRYQWISKQFKTVE